MKIKEAAELTGVSIRTLHHYDDIGLIRPKRSGSNAYRQYTDEDLAKLQQVLFFKKLGFKLSHIKEIINQPGYSQEEALVMQKRMLQKEMARISKMMETIDLTIRNIQGEIDMTNEEKFKGIDFSQNPYEQEAKERWGADAVEATKEKIARKDRKSLEERFDEIYTGLADIRHLDPSSGEAQAHIEEWYVYLNEVGDYSLEMFKSLGDMYVEDERFRKNIDRYGEGLAEFMRAAMKEYHNQNGAVT